MSKTNKEVLGSVAMSSPVHVVFRKGKEPVVGDILLLAAIAYRLEKDGLWYTVTLDTVFKDSDIKWRMDDVDSMTTVSGQYEFPVDPGQGQKVVFIRVAGGTAALEGFYYTNGGWAKSLEQTMSAGELPAAFRDDSQKPDKRVGVFEGHTYEHQGRHIWRMVEQVVIPAKASVPDVTWIDVRLEGLTDKSVKMMKTMWPDAKYDGQGKFSVPVKEQMTPREQHDYSVKLLHSACDYLGVPRSTPFYEEPAQLPPVTEHVEMPPVKAAKPEQGEVTYSANTPDKGMEFRMGGATIAQIESVQKIFPSLEHRGDGYFVLTLPNLGAVGEYPDPAVREQYASVIYKGVCDIMNNTAPGYVHQEATPVTEERQVRPYDHFLTDPMNIPPRRGSNEDKRRGNIRAALAGVADMTVPQLVDTLKRHAEQLDPTAEGAREDVGILCLGVLGRTQAKIKKRKQRRITLGVAFAALLVVAGFAGTEFVKKNLVSSNYTTINECKVPFGDTELEGKRFRTYTYKSLLGYRFGSNNDISVERLEVKLPGSDITILGRDDDKAKPWRLTYAKGEYGTAILKPSAQYWFVGNGDRTTLVNNNEFCH